jgi:hypothetical protein
MCTDVLFYRVKPGAGFDNLFPSSCPLLYKRKVMFFDSTYGFGKVFMCREDGADIDKRPYPGQTTLEDIYQTLWVCPEEFYCESL